MSDLNRDPQLQQPNRDPRRGGVARVLGNIAFYASHPAQVIIGLTLLTGGIHGLREGDTTQAATGLGGVGLILGADVVRAVTVERQRRRAQNHSNEQ